MSLMERRNITHFPCFLSWCSSHDMRSLSGGRITVGSALTLSSLALFLLGALMPMRSPPFSTHTLCNFCSRQHGRSEMEATQPSCETLSVGVPAGFSGASGLSPSVGPPIWRVTPVRKAWRPVNISARVGVQVGWAQNCSNTTPLAANLSRLGVCAVLFPRP